MISDENADTAIFESAKQRKRDSESQPSTIKEYKRGMRLHKESDVSKYDIGLYFDKKLTSNETYEVVSNMWQPDDAFTFPITMEGNSDDKPKRRKKIVRNWLKTYNWLAYSKMYDGAFCVPCVFFGQATGHNSGKLDWLYKSPLTFWSSATTKLKNHHHDCDMHKAAVPAMERFLSVKRGETDAINVQLDRQRKTIIERNRQKLIPIVKSVTFCGKQTIPLRGHRDDETYQESSRNKGNFQELLNFRIESGDTILKEHFETAPKNASYKSKTIQNEIIECTGDHILHTIVKEIKRAGIFTIIADETPDVSRKEQLAISVRYVGDQGCIQEKFLKFIECDTGTSAIAIAEKIKRAISDLGLDIANLRGQAYDGASNMSGKNAGVAKLIQKSNELAIYIHCFAHRLNLCVAGACNQQLINNMMNTVRCVSEFFGFPKRAELLRKNVENYTPKEKHNTLLDVCKTRWIQRIDGLARFEEMYEVIMLTLQSVRDNVGGHWSIDSTNRGSSLFNACSEFPFLFSLVVTKYWLYLLKPLTAGLQERELDIKKAYENVNFVKKSLMTARSTVENIHTNLFNRAKILANFVGVAPSTPRICRSGKQINRDNHDAKDASEYFRLTVTIPFLDHVINEIEDRFGDAPALVIKGFCILPDIFLNDRNENWKVHFFEFAKHYERDMVCLNTIDPELLMWETYWKKEYKGSIPCTISDTLKVIFPMRASFPNIYAALRLIATLPVTSCECERSISVLRRLKTYLRSTMGQTRLNGLALMSIHRDIPLNFDDILTRFAIQHPRRIELIDLLRDCDCKNLLCDCDCDC